MPPSMVLSLSAALRRRVLTWLLKPPGCCRRARRCEREGIGGDKEALWQFNAALRGELCHEWAPPPGHPIRFPHVDGLAADVDAGHLFQPLCERGAATQSVNEICMAMGTCAHAKTVSIFLRNVKPDVWDDMSAAYPQNARMPKRTAETRDPLAIECGERLRRFRIHAAGYRSLRAFAHDTGVSEGNLTNWEKGWSLVPPWYVQRLKGLMGLTHDYIYGGDLGSLRQDLAVKVAAVDHRMEDD